MMERPIKSHKLFSIEAIGEMRPEQEIKHEIQEIMHSCQLVVTKREINPQGSYMLLPIKNAPRIQKIKGPSLYMRIIFIQNEVTFHLP